MQDTLEERKPPHERRSGTPFDGAVIPLGAEICDDPISTKDKKSSSSIWYKSAPGIYIGYAVSSGGGWTTHLIIADWHDTENNVASEVHVKRFKSKERIKKLPVLCFISLRRCGSLRPEGHAQRRI